MARVRGRMAIGINPEAIVDWSPAWTFIDVFRASRPWISQLFNTQTFTVTYDPALAPLLDLDARGNVRSLQSLRVNGVPMRQYASTLIFRDTGTAGAYPGGIYRAEWDGAGEVRFSFDAQLLSSGVTASGRRFALLQVTPSSNGILVTIESTEPSNPVRDINLWMPDYQGQSFSGKRWQPGASFSPFHPLYLERLAPFKTLRFMAMQETNSSDIVTWNDRRPVDAVRQSSGAEGTPSQPLVNGMSVEYMVQLANDLDADPWFNMPHKADDNFVRSFATYVRQNLEPGRRVYVEWANELWNFGYGFEASQWVADQVRAQGLSSNPDGQWIVTGQQAARDMRIWSEVFSGVTDKQLVRVAAGWAAVDYVSDVIAANMDSAFDAIAIAPYITPTDAQRASYSAATTVDRVLADTRINIEESLRWTRNHRALADAWSARLGRPIELLAYEGGPHLDGRNQPYQPAFLAAVKDPRIGSIYADYLRGLDAAGLDLYLDFQFTSQQADNAFGDFGKLHRMDQPLETVYSYNVLRAAADGSLWGPELQLEPRTLASLEGAAGTSTVLNLTIRRSGELTGVVSVNWAVIGSGSNPANAADFAGGVLPSGRESFQSGESSRTIAITIAGDNSVELDESFRVQLSNPVGATLSSSAAEASATIINDDLPVITLAIVPASVSEDGSANLIYTFTRTGPTTNALTVNYSVAGTATLGTDYTGIATTGTPKSLPFAAGSATATVTVDPRSDTSIETDETVVLTLVSGAGYAIGTRATATGTITNDDLPVINVAVSPASVNEDGSANLIYTFTRSGPTTNALTVNYNVGGTAILGTDYTGITSTGISSTGISSTGTTKSLPFAANFATATVTVDPSSDALIESDETVVLTLSSGTGYAIGTSAAASGTIRTDDIVSASSITLGSDDSSVTLTGSGRSNATGNGRDNVITGNSSNNRLAGLAGKDILTGGGTSDRDLFCFFSLSDSLLVRPGNTGQNAFDEITDFSRRDRLLAPFSVSLDTEPLTTALGSVPSASASALASLLSTNTFSKDAAVAFTVTGFSGTFIAMNDGRAGFQADSDCIVFLQNYTISSSNPVEII